MRRPVLIAAAALAAGGLLLTGCGSKGTSAPLPKTVEGTVAQPTETEPPGPTLEGDAVAGKTVFSSNGCGSCHVLADANTAGVIGPNLDNSKPSAELVVDRVTNGRGTMPALKDKLSAQQIADVAAYVFESTQGG